MYEILVFTKELYGTGKSYKYVLDGINIIPFIMFVLDMYEQDATHYHIFVNNKPTHIITLQGNGKWFLNDQTFRVNGNQRTFQEINDTIRELVG